MDQLCSQCGEKLDSVFTTDLTAKTELVEVSLRAFPYRSCTQNHDKIYVYPEFGRDLHDFLYGGAIPRTKKGGGLFGRGDVCARCGARLEWIRMPLLEFRLEPRLRTAPPFELVLRMPAIACSNCVTVQVRASTFGRTVDPFDAILSAFQAAGIEPADMAT
jgi:hypothetical protein